ncbi:glycosyltransferase [Rubrolithibacter danxiaensis]|uniref:glycosyltransferase n=1 Tax=Rubrolithibacter danxiaensis TaxID=3390805 RepID=UPI003BF7A444
MKNTDLHLVSCIMPTCNRRRFVPHAIRYFMRQDYFEKELIILDDGTDSVEELIPPAKNIRYFRLSEKITLGAKLNMGCRYARGKIIANWDDDDWYDSRRLTYQIEQLLNSQAKVCGINRLLYYNLNDEKALQYIYPPNQRPWLLGSSLCYYKEHWKKNQFAEIDVGMDALFVWNTPSDKVKALPDSTIAVHMIHQDNASPKQTDDLWWHPYEVEKVKKIINGDWFVYDKMKGAPAAEPLVAPLKCKPAAELPKKIKNTYVCLVHENEDCIIDLVRNLHYHDPESSILLYNGSGNDHLINKRFPFRSYGAIVYPHPLPVKHGYLHEFALRAMEFVTENLEFDTLTIVDSDQLAIRSGYSDYVSRFMASKTNVGMFSNRAERVNPDNQDVWTATQAFKEYDLWKPFLQKFPGGEDKFVHWTFWPSTVFTADAALDLVKIFKQDKQLQQIVSQSEIWATEEIILPTVVKLLGYEILSNPCTYQYVQYQKKYSLQDVKQALTDPTAFWIHPVERKYDNSIRTNIREQFNHYSKETERASEENILKNMLSTTTLLGQIKKIEGWLSEGEADLLISTTLKAGIELPAPHAIVEVGSYQGKSTVLLGSVVKAYFPRSKVYAIDPHNGVVGAVGQLIESLSPTLENFKRNIEEAGIGEVVQLIKDFSFNVSWGKPISLLFIDGLHDYPNVSRDFWHFANWVMAGGYIAFHDYADYYPGVKAFVNELLRTEKYVSVQISDSLIVIQKQE